MTGDLATGQMLSSPTLPTHKFSPGDDFLIDFQDNDLYREKTLTPLEESEESCPYNITMQGVVIRI